jgi:hypothetical protein
MIDPKKFDDENILNVLARALIERRANMKEGIEDEEGNEEDINTSEWQ